MKLRATIQIDYEVNPDDYDLNTGVLETERRLFADEFTDGLSSHPIDEVMVTVEERK